MKILICLFLSMLVCSAQWSPRKWTNAEGTKTFTGTLSQIHDTKITLINKDGKKYLVSITSLSKKDHLYLESAKKQKNALDTINMDNTILKRHLVIAETLTGPLLTTLERLPIRHINHIYNVQKDGILARSNKTDLFIVCDTTNITDGDVRMRFENLYEIGFYRYTTVLGSERKIVKCTPDQDVFFKWFNEKNKEPAEKDKSPSK